MLELRMNPPPAPANTNAFADRRLDVLRGAVAEQLAAVDIADESGPVAVFGFDAGDVHPGHRLRLGRIKGGYR